MTHPLFWAFRPRDGRLSGGLALSVYDSTQTSAENDLLNAPVVRWGLVLIGIAIGFLTLDIMLRRPLVRELASVRRELASVEKCMQNLVGMKEVAWESSHLLSALQAQKKQLVSARAALGVLSEFRQSVETEAQQTGDAATSLNRISELQKRVVGQSESVVAVEQVLSDIVKLHQRLLLEKQAQEDAVVSLNRVSALHKQVRHAGQDAEVAAVEVQKLGDLRTKVIENSAGVEQAQRKAAELIVLKDTVRQAEDVLPVQEAANKLLALRDSLRPNDDSTEQSQTHAKQLLSLRDELAANAEDTQLAQKNWVSVRKLEGDLKSAGHDIANAIETLELLTDLGTELRQQTQSLAGVRQTMAEIALMETTIGRVLRVLEPLAQLKNLTRLSESEVRAAARAILDQRNSKLSHREGPQPVPPVKLPHEDNLFSDDPVPVIGTRAVPMPRDLSEDIPSAVPGSVD
jgi:hypothetical protein